MLWRCVSPYGLDYSNLSTTYRANESIMSAAASTEALQLAKDLWRQVKGGTAETAALPCQERCRQILQSLCLVIDKAPAFKMEVLVKTLTTAQKAFRVQKRRCANTNAAKSWQELLDMSQRLLSTVHKKQQNVDRGSGSDDAADDGTADQDTATTGLPSSVGVYLQRLQKQRKELYKNPPALPPSPAVVVQDATVGPPVRNKKTNELTFATGQDETLSAQLKLFHPNRTPAEILQGGAFGGTYFRSIWSAVTNEQYAPKQVLRDTVDKNWIAALDTKTMLTSQMYSQHVNKWKSKCGGSLGMWESSGWISDADPYGWFQWYCRFYQGRRCSDDKRQISRWTGIAGLKGRFKSQLCNKIIAANTKPDDAKISPVIRQTLWHWGLEITEDVLDKHRKRK